MYNDLIGQYILRSGAGFFLHSGKFISFCLMKSLAKKLEELVSEKDTNTRYFQRSIEFQKLLNQLKKPALSSSRVMTCQWQILLARIITL
jgi:hypothetical protein